MAIDWFAIAALILATHMMKNLMVKHQKHKINKPKTYDDYIHKLCYITEKNVFDIFKIAMEEHSPWQFSDDRIKQDINNYIKTKNPPSYVKNFIDEGKKVIEEIEIFEIQ